MKSPHDHGWGPYQDPFPNRVIHEEEERLIMAGYKFLGWQVSTDIPEYKHCINAGHNYITAFPHAWKNKQHNRTGSDVTQWCTICKIYWKTDMSD